MLSKDLLSELKAILNEDYGIQLTDNQLTEFGSAIVAYFELLAKIQSQNEESSSKQSQ